MLFHDTNLFTVHIKKGVIRNQEEGANLDGEDDNFSTYTHKYFFSILKVIIIVQFYPCLLISSIKRPLD